MTDARRANLIIFGYWLVISALLTWHGWGKLMDRNFPDPDDAMRLMQVRDWLAGQSWFDVTQYRLNPPAGGPMHWSRLVDLPIAAVMLIARPLLGQFGAETAALVVVPMLTLCITMFLVHRVASKLLDGSGALLAVIATPGSLGVLKQMRILRIDHHGWQIVAALVAMLGVLDEERPRRGAVSAGIAMAFWLNISIEGLPFAVAVAAWFAFKWLTDAAAGDRLKSYLAALAGASAFLFGATHWPSTWLSHPHDVLNIAHLGAFTAAWIACIFAVRPDVASFWHRLGLLALAGAIVAAVAFGIDPHFLQGPFQSLDPLVANLWYNGVDEGLPLWRLTPSTAGIGFAQPLVGLAGALLALRLSSLDRRGLWQAYLYLLAAGTLTSVFVIREATTTSVLAMPGTAFLCDFALRRARRVHLMPLRVIATAGAVCIMTPAYALPASLSKAEPNAEKTAHDTASCTSRAEIVKLNALPPSNIASLLDVTPAILASTQHRAIAGSYHRNNDGIRDVIKLFVDRPEVGREILERRHIAYLVYCPKLAETQWWAANGPQGLAAMLNANKAPDWLQPVPIQGLRGLRVYRFVQG